MERVFRVVGRAPWGRAIGCMHCFRSYARLLVIDGTGAPKKDRRISCNETGCSDEQTAQDLTICNPGPPLPHMNRNERM